MLADEVMTRQLITVTPQTSVRKAMEALRRHRLHDIPVVDGEGRPCGVVSGKAILHAALPGYVSENLLDSMRGLPDIPPIYEHLRQIADLPVADVMEKRYYVVRSDSPTSAVAAMLVHLNSDSHNILVTDGDGRLVGTISPLDIFDQMQRP